MDRTEAYPLRWPTVFPRTEEGERQVGRFTASFASARDGLMDELRLMGVHGYDIVISTNVPLRKDGLPYATKMRYDDPGVAVYFVRDGRQLCIPCDRWALVEHNLQAIRLTIQALRGLERWTGNAVVDATFAGFEALPERSETGWWTVLGVSRMATEGEIRSAYIRRVKMAHPDGGGSPDWFRQVQQAYKDAIEQL